MVGAAAGGVAVEVVCEDDRAWYCDDPRNAETRAVVASPSHRAAAEDDAASKTGRPPLLVDEEVEMQNGEKLTSGSAGLEPQAILPRMSSRLPC